MSPRPLAPRSSRLTRAILLASTIVIAAPLVDAGMALATVEGQKAEVQRIVDQLDALHEQADILAEDYAVAVDEQTQLDADIVKAAEQLAAKEAELDTLRGDLAEVAVRTFTGAGSDVLGPLFSDASSYSAGLRRDQYSRVALNAGTGTTDDLDELIREIDEEASAISRTSAIVPQQLAEEIDRQQVQVEQLTAQYVEQRGAAEARLGELIAAEEERRRTPRSPSCSARPKPTRRTRPAGKPAVAATPARRRPTTVAPTTAAATRRRRHGRWQRRRWRRQRRRRRQRRAGVWARRAWRSTPRWANSVCRTDTRPRTRASRSTVPVSPTTRGVKPASTCRATRERRPRRRRTCRVPMRSRAT